MDKPDSAAPLAVILNLLPCLYSSDDSPSEAGKKGICNDCEGEMVMNSDLRWIGKHSPFGCSVAAAEHILSAAAPRQPEGPPMQEALEATSQDLHVKLWALASTWDFAQKAPSGVGSRCANELRQALEDHKRFLAQPKSEPEGPQDLSEEEIAMLPALLKAADDLCFDCDGVLGTKAPRREVYNLAFASIKAARERDLIPRLLAHRAQPVVSRADAELSADVPLVAELGRLAEAFADSATAYEKDKNASGAAQLRRTSNLLYSLAQTGTGVLFTPLPTEPEPADAPLDALREALEAVRSSAQCACSLREVESGHRGDCWLPHWLEVARAALAAAPRDEYQLDYQRELDQKLTRARLTRDGVVAAPRDRPDELQALARNTASYAKAIHGDLCGGQESHHGMCTTALAIAEQAERLAAAAPRDERAQGFAEGISAAVRIVEERGSQFESASYLADRFRGLASALRCLAPAAPLGAPSLERLALQNVRMLCARAKARKTPGLKEGELEHLLRFCREGGVEGSILRETEPLGAPVARLDTHEAVLAERKKWQGALVGACDRCLRSAAGTRIDGDELADDFPDCKECGTALRDLVQGVEPLGGRTLTEKQSPAPSASPDARIDPSLDIEWGANVKLEEDGLPVDVPIGAAASLEVEALIEALELRLCCAVDCVEPCNQCIGDRDTIWKAGRHE